MADMTTTFLHDQLLSRRQRLQSVIATTRAGDGLVELLDEVDSALERMENGTYGICEVCHDPVETERLIADPLMRYCLDHLTREQQRELEQDLQLAAEMQRDLLPRQGLKHHGWEIAYHYQPLGPVSGDYCDVITRNSDGDGLFFVLGDASGKGVAASMLMAHLHAIFRTLVATGLPVHELVQQAGRVFCETTMSPYFATLVCGRAAASGEVEICNAGHCPPLLVRGNEVTSLEATGLPLGMFCDGGYVARRLTLAPGDTLFLYTDGVSESRSASHEEYGEERLARVVAEGQPLPLEALVRTTMKDLADFRAGAPALDDLTVMAVRRSV
ncbi:MAG TPA: SpoIIE family protein phosphatase [Terriglobia bacterium]|nr:SpoIIE family protein phosphatase [Terriglobia bacterium]